MGDSSRNRIRFSWAFVLLPTLLLSWAGLASADRCLGDLPARVPLEGMPLNVIAVDANRDGVPDLVAATIGSATRSWAGLEVVTSHEAGGMAVTARIEKAGLHGGLAAGDFNGDGFDDVAVAPGNGVTDAVLTLFLGDGRGGFSLGPRTRLPAVCGRSPVRHDFNGDSNLDVVLIGCSGIVNLLLGDGSGRFTSRDLDLQFSATRIAAADFDSDGIVDLALAGRPRSTGVRPSGRVALGSGLGAQQTERRMEWLSIWRGDGEGGFVEHSEERIPAGAQSLLVADFNRDSVPDLAVASQGSPGAWNSTLGVLIGIGNGNFLELVEYEATALPSSLAAADVDRDGIIDLIGSGFAVGVLRGDGTGGFEAWDEIDIMPGLIVAEDFSGDGAIDIASAPLRAGGLTILKGDGRGGWITGPTGYPVGESVRAATAADVDRDGAPDVAALIEEHGKSGLVLLLNREGALLPAGPAMALSGRPFDIAAGDFNGDDLADLALADTEEEQLAILHGNGTGEFRQGPVIELGMPRTITVGDMDADGRDDLVVTLLRDSSTVVLTEDRQGRLSTIARVRNGAQHHPVQLGDLDSDGDLDLLSVAPHSRELRPALNNGKGSFLPSDPITLEHYPDSVILAEIDNDGSPDVIVTHTQQDSVLVFRSSLGGLSGRPEMLRVRGGPRHLAAGDFGGDGHHDLVVTGQLDRAITFIPGARNRLRIARVAEAFSVRSVIAALDFNLDGFDDLATIGPGPGRITILGSCASHAAPR